MSRCCCCCLRTSGRRRWCCWTGTSRGMSLALGVSGGVGGCGVGDGGSCLPCLRRNECGGFNECGFGTYYCCRVVLARQDRFTSKTTGPSRAIWFYGNFRRWLRRPSQWQTSVRSEKVVRAREPQGCQALAFFRVSGAKVCIRMSISTGERRLRYTKAAGTIA
jgi:hypothetical protein